MKINYKMISLFAMCSFALVACGPKKSEENKTPPTEKRSPQVPEKKNEKGLMPQEEEIEIINEDEVFDRVPG